MMRTVLVLVAVLAFARASFAQDAPMKVASGQAPTIDGSLKEDAWKAATRVELAPEGEAWLLQDEQALFVGLRVGKTCLPSLALLQDGKVHVLHASASLGTAVYERTGDAWKVAQAFTWRCREGRTSDKERARFLADEGWLGTTAGVGEPGEAEFRIDRRLLTEAPVRLAVVACRLQPGTPAICVWPRSVQDGTKERELIFGRTPELSFDPDTWARLDLGPTLTPAERFASALTRIQATAEAKPVEAYHTLVDLLEGHAKDVEGREEAVRLKRDLAKRKPVAREIAAQRKLASALRTLRKKLKELEEKYPETRAARRAGEQRAALDE